MAICCPESIRAYTMQLCRLDACGVPLPTSVPMSRINTNGYMSLTISPDIEDGEVLEKKNAAGDFCIQNYDCPRLKKLDLTLNLCGVPPHVLEMLTGQSLLMNGVDVVGGLFPNVNYNTVVAGTSTEPKAASACGNGIGIEFFTENNQQNQNCEPGTKPWVSWILPKTINWIVTSDLNFSNEILEVELEGIAFGNSNFEPCDSTSPWTAYQQEVQDTNTPLGYLCVDDCPSASDCEYVAA